MEHHAQTTVLFLMSCLLARTTPMTRINCLVPKSRINCHNTFIVTKNDPARASLFPDYFHYSPIPFKFPLDKDEKTSFFELS
jgi:hypothetical protein